MTTRPTLQVRVLPLPLFFPVPVVESEGCSAAGAYSFLKGDCYGT